MGKQRMPRKNKKAIKTKAFGQPSTYKRQGVSKARLWW